MVWPPQNPDLTAFGNSLWGIVKEKISQLRQLKIEEQVSEIASMTSNRQH
jgi:hypothetical protein